MKKFLIILVLGSQFIIAENERLNHVPNIKLKMLNGEKIQLYDFFNEGPLLVDFWATGVHLVKRK